MVRRYNAQVKALIAGPATGAVASRLVAVTPLLIEVPEWTPAAAESMSQQAQQLVGAVAVFKLQAA